MSRALTRLGLAATAFLLLAGVDKPQQLPYRIWWSFPNDDDTAIEVDDPDLSVSRYQSRWQFAVAMQKCDQRRSKQLAKQKSTAPVREMKIEALEADGAVRSSQRCVMTMTDWRARIGKPLLDRLEDELDAHAAFLVPRHFPGENKPLPSADKAKNPEEPLPDRTEQHLLEKP